MSFNIYALIAAAVIAAHVTSAQNDTSSPASMPPALTLFSEKLIYFRSVSDTIVLQCGANGIPTPTYSWRKDGVAFDYSSKSNIKLQSQGSLIFSPTTGDDVGRYQCFVSNKWGVAATDVTFLQMATPAMFPQSSTVPTYTVRQGSSTRLRCNPPTSVPAASYSWVVSRGAQDLFPQPVSPSNRIQVDQQLGDLYFAYTTTADTRNGTVMYRCNAYNSFLALTTGGSYSYLVITDAAFQPIAPGLLFTSNSPVTALIGQTIDLVCFFSGYPVPALTWKKSGGSLPTGRYILDNYDTTLRISDVQLADVGTYECIATNSAGTSQITIQLQVEAEPTFMNTSASWPSGVNATDGDTVNFTCSTWGIPDPNIVWMSNAQPLNPNGLPGKFSLSSNKQVLTIRNVCKSCPGGGTDLQTIQCNASNYHGYLYSTSYLNVFERTEITSPPQNLALEPGTPSVLSCQYSYDAGTPLTVTWYFNDQPFVGEPGKVFVEPDGDLYFNTPQLPNGGASYAGNYTCIVSNGYSSDQASALVSPVVALRQSSVADYWWVFVIVFILLLLIIVIFAVFRYVRQNRGDTYAVDEKERDTGNDPVKELLDYGFQDYSRATDAAPLVPKTAGTLGTMGHSFNLSSDDSASYNNDSYRLYK